MSNSYSKTTIENLYDRITGDEDARVCRDIPNSACNDQPRNFFTYLVANLFGKIADEIASAKLMIPWLFGMLGVPDLITGFLVPIRESGVLLPQLFVAAAIRKKTIRKTVWMFGSILSAISLFGMAIASFTFTGTSAGLMILVMLVVFSLSRGICSVAAKDVLGKTVSKSRRGRLMGWSTSISGVAVLLIGLWMGTVDMGDVGLHFFFSLLIAGGFMWIIATVIFAFILEQPGATSGGGNAISVAAQQIALLKTDTQFRQFIVTRSLLLSVALASPFYVLIAQAESGSALTGLGILIIANGLANSLSAPFWGSLGDRSSRTVMMVAAFGAGILGVFTFLAVSYHWSWCLGNIGFAIIFMALNIMHGGVRLGRKIYLVDMATAENRAAYVAVSNTVIGVLMLFAGFIGLLGDQFGSETIILILGIVSLLAAFYIQVLPEVSES